MTRKDAADQLETIASKLSDAGEHSAAWIVRGSIQSVLSAQSEVQHPRPPSPPADLAPDLPAALKDAVDQLRELVSKLSDAGDHSAAEVVIATIEVLARAP